MNSPVFPSLDDIYCIFLQLIWKKKYFLPFFAQIISLPLAIVYADVKWREMTLKNAKWRTTSGLSKMLFFLKSFSVAHMVACKTTLI